METVAAYVRICPTCRTENAPEVMRCACGALLAGIDVVRKADANAPAPADSSSSAPAEASPTAVAANRSAAASAPNQPPFGNAEAQTPATAPGAAAPSGEPIVCLHPDCGQKNAPESATCAYCNRPLVETKPLAPQSLLHLPAVLGARFRIVRTLPAKGAEAELIVVQPRAGGPERIAKIYRQGIEPRRDVATRVARIEQRHRVGILEAGTADGHAYELLEYCPHGSLRDLLARGSLEGEALTAVVRELAAAIASVHAANLVHRDLKPENVLVRSVAPLELVLTDFSIASVLEGTQRFTSVARTLPYASPESLSGVIDGKSDYWALGMIVLEAVLGRHPFAGLSEAVILHQLTTRNVDAAAIADRNVRKLVRGLLLRDPLLRWGESELSRWLANDPALPEPVEQGPAVAFAEPYRLADAACTTFEQLGVALATHWREGVADLGNGQLLAWFRGVQKDHNVVRLLIEMRHERQMHVDVQLLKLILYLAPGIPPVWRGESIALPAILAHATQALEGDLAAAQWLHTLYQHRVLEAYVDAGNQKMKDVLERWNVASDGFDKAWKDALALLKKKAPKRGPDEAVDWDAAMYGLLDPHPPSIVNLHARLLAIAYDASWAERLRKRLLAELAKLLVHCPWFSELGDPLTMTPTSLLVLEAILPEAQKVAERQVRANMRKRSEEAEDCRAKTSELADVVASLRALAERRFPTEELCDELMLALQRYFDLLAAIREAGRTDEPWLALRSAAIRSETIARRMQRAAERLRERLAVSGGWLNARTAVPLIFMLLLLPRLGARIVVPLMILVPIGIIGWQLVPNFLLLGEIRALAEKL